MFVLIQHCLIWMIGFCVLYIQSQQIETLTHQGVALNQVSSAQANNTQYLERRINNLAAELSDFEYKTKARLDVFDARIRLSQ